MTFWAGQIWDSEAYGVGLQLKATTYPFLALLICHSNKTVQIADKLQGWFLIIYLLYQLFNYLFMILTLS